MKLKTIVITSIAASDNPCILRIAENAIEKGVPVIIAGDLKSPSGFSVPGVDYYDIEKQNLLFPELAQVMPYNHYARKNFGYLAAIIKGADIIHETDDDNYPLISFWEEIPETMEVDLVSTTGKWLNIYKLYSKENIWPRGFSLDAILHQQNFSFIDVSSKALIIQGLANENPDLDAIFRLTQPLPLDFLDRCKPAMVAMGIWCPFNSQNTIFKKPVFPLLYIPSYCSFRMTDIWRSFVAQRCLWELNEGIVFTNASVRQERNDHSLIKDFEQEIPGYLQNEKITDILSNTQLKSDPSDNLVICYEALIKAKIFPEEELKLVSAWLNEIHKFL